MHNVLTIMTMFLLSISLNISAKNIAISNQKSRTAMIACTDKIENLYFNYDSKSAFYREILNRFSTYPTSSNSQAILNISNTAVIFSALLEAEITEEPKCTSCLCAFYCFFTCCKGCCSTTINHETSFQLKYCVINLKKNITMDDNKEQLIIPAAILADNSCSCLTQQTESTVECIEKEITIDKSNLSLSEEQLSKYINTSQSLEISTITKSTTNKPIIKSNLIGMSNNTTSDHHLILSGHNNSSSGHAWKKRISVI